MGLTTADRSTRVVGDRRLRGDSGGMLVEAALVMPMFIYLVFGVIDYSSVFRDYHTTSYVMQVGGRVASVEGSHPEADYLALSRMRSAGMALPADAIERIVVWRATDDGSGAAWRAGATSVVPPACKTATVGDATYACNVYTRVGGTVNPSSAMQANWGNCTSTGNPSRYWCASTRKSAAQGINGPPDYMGVYVEVLHKHYTGAFGATVVISQQGVFTLEASTLQ